MSDVCNAPKLIFKDSVTGPVEANVSIEFEGKVSPVELSDETVYVLGEVQTLATNGTLELVASTEGDQ